MYQYNLENRKISNYVTGNWHCRSFNRACATLIHILTKIVSVDVFKKSVIGQVDVSYQSTWRTSTFEPVNISTVDVLAVSPDISLSKNGLYLTSAWNDRHPSKMYWVVCPFVLLLRSKVLLLSCGEYLN